MGHTLRNVRTDQSSRGSSTREVQTLENPELREEKEVLVFPITSANKPSF